MIPTIKIEGCKLSENAYISDNLSYDIPSLIKYCEEKEYPIFDLPIAGIPLGDMPLTINNMKDFVSHCLRVEKTNLDYPIILDDLGRIADGYHRLTKALMLGNTTIKAIRIEEMPPSSGEINVKK